MKNSFGLKASVILLLVVAWFLVPATTKADSGTLTTTNTTLTYTHGPFFVANTTSASTATGGVAPTCTAATPCDDYTLNVNVPAGTDAANVIQVQLAWDQSATALAEFDLWVLDSTGNVIASNQNGNTPDIVQIPAVSGTYTVRAVPYIPNGESYTGTISLQSKSITTLPPDTAPASSGMAPRFQNYAVPSSLGGNNEGEPSIGVNWNTGNVMDINGLQTFKVAFDDTTSPAKSTWTDVSAFNTSKLSLDPILVTDHTSGRTFVSQLTGQDSLTSFTDNDGAAWTPS
ncbi:MAG TPA: hypothetical protein VF221_23515, partial [Chloroflexota bacterium]